MPAITEPTMLELSTVVTACTFPAIPKVGVQLIAYAANDKFSAYGSVSTVAVNNTSGAVTTGSLIPQASTSNVTFGVTPQLLPANMFQAGGCYAGTAGVPTLYLVASTTTQRVLVIPA